ncbi:hypothetical protein ACFY41_29280 [Streptomyces syringium]|uniref:hypothetical protein n=1 Tax=Streptomyces syringium TaxID=76729 RepID=UPI0036D10DCA
MGWEQAYARAQKLAAADQVVASEGSWEFVGVRGILAVVLAALGEGVDGPEGPSTVPTGSLLWHLDQGPDHVRTLAGFLLGEEMDQATDIDPDSVNMNDARTATWVWLTRTWPQAGPWDGKTRGVARGLPDPAVEVLTRWAASAALTALAEERGALPPGTPVRVTAGKDEGRIATVEISAWLMDDARETVVDGPAPGYQVWIRDREAPTGRRRELLRSEELRCTTRDERAEVLGLQTRFESVWHACEVWARELVRWHQDTSPEVWLTARDAETQAVLVEALLAAALYDTARKRGLDQPADGSKVHLTPFSPMLDILGAPYTWDRVVEMLTHIDTTVTTPVIELLHALQAAPPVPAGTEESTERRALVELAEAVILAHASAAPLPAETSVQQLTSGEIEPRLVDQALAIVEAARRRRQADLTTGTSDEF